MKTVDETYFMEFQYCNCFFYARLQGKAKNRRKISFKRLLAKVNKAVKKLLASARKARIVTRSY